MEFASRLTSNIRLPSTPNIRLPSAPNIRLPQPPSNLELPRVSTPGIRMPQLPSFEGLSETLSESLPSRESSSGSVGSRSSLGRLPSLPRPSVRVPNFRWSRSSSSAELPNDTSTRLMTAPQFTGFLPLVSATDAPSADASEPRGSWMLLEDSELSCLCAGLTMKERLYGFSAFFCGGFVLSLAAFLSWGSLFLGRPQKFATTYTLGNMFMLISLFFLVGPMRQLRLMCTGQRRIASLVYVLCMLLTMACIYFKWSRYGLALEGALATLIAIVAQMLALLWYALSFIPFGRSAVGRLCTRFYTWCFDT